MTNYHRAILWLLLTVALLMLAACGSGESLSEEDRIATRVAEELAVAATLTSSASTPTEEPALPTDTPAAVALATDTPIPPTDTPVIVESVAITSGGDDDDGADATPAVATAVNEISTPDNTDTPTPTLVPEATATPESTATPEPTPVILEFSPVDGNDGNDFVRGSLDINQGRVILLPGFAPEEVIEPMVFRDRIDLRVEVFDTRYGLQDGDGIVSVTYSIEDLNGNAVYEKLEETAAFCLFGGNEPICNGLPFEQAGYQWPGGGEIVNGEYVARIDIVPQEGEVTQWRWGFEIDIPGREALDEPTYTEPSAEENREPNTARITDINESNGRYIVGFETIDFEPTLPGQHLHFFWDIVPPEQAGLPGAGPWQIYPAGQGGSGASPFTLFAVADRPNNASQICVLVANADHSVNQQTGNCFDLP